MSDHHDCNCGCSCGHDHHNVQTIELTTDDGNALTCQVIGTFELDGNDYIALLPEDCEDAFIYGFVEDGDEIELRKIDADQEFEKVSQHFLSFYE